MGSALPQSASGCRAAIRQAATRPYPQRDRDVSLAEAASRDVWWPFTQHGSVSPGSIMTVDSRWGDDLTVLENDSRGDREWGQVYDACCSWWTQVGIHA